MHSSRSRSSRAQTQRVPSPITWGSEMLEGEDVLREFPGEVGFLRYWTSPR